jgi:hypothetical protein
MVESCAVGKIQLEVEVEVEVAAVLEVESPSVDGVNLEIFLFLVDDDAISFVPAVVERGEWSGGRRGGKGEGSGRDRGGGRIEDIEVREEGGGGEVKEGRGGSEEEGGGGGGGERARFLPMVPMEGLLKRLTLTGGLVLVRGRGGGRDRDRGRGRGRERGRGRVLKDGLTAITLDTSFKTENKKI